jgi:o-succinylbenzoate---CoA ligase
VPELVTIDLPGGRSFVDAVRRVWDRGDAVFPLDRRLPATARAAVIAEVQPTRWLDDDGERRVDGAPVHTDDALVMATSGTTGTPKAVVLTRPALVAAASAVHRRIDLRPDDRWLACLPLGHMGGFGVIARAVLDDVPLEVHDGFDAGAVIAAARSGTTLVSLVPTALTRLDPAAFRVVVLGGARPPADRPPNCVATYGLTETGGGVVYDGRPLDGVEVDITADGTIRLRGPMLARGVRGSAAPLLDAEGWLDTGDVGWWLPDGRLHVQGRRGDMIITGGENVWPELVEQHLLDHPYIADVAIIGVEDHTWGQQIVALVVTATTVPDRIDLKDFLADRLPVYMVPRRVVSVPAIPRTSLGKIARGSLPELLAQHD